MTKNGKITVLYVNHEDNVVGGASWSLDNLIRSVNEYVIPVILLRSEGPVADFFRSKGYECIVFHTGLFRHLHQAGLSLFTTVSREDQRIPFGRQTGSAECPNGCFRTFHCPHLTSTEKEILFFFCIKDDIILRTYSIREAVCRQTVL